MLKRFKNKVVVITGGNGGIGSETAKQLQSEGANVVIFGRDNKSIKSVISELGSDAVGVEGDVASEIDLIKLFAEVKSKYGRIDSLFVNAGISRSAKIDELSEEFIDELFAINVKGAMLTIKNALPLMSEDSNIVVTSSNVIHRGHDQLSVYSATKGALQSMVRSLAIELMPRKIRINSVSPGPIDTRLLTKGLNLDDHKKTMSMISELIPMKRMGEPHEIAKAVLFLASTDSSFMTGEEIIVDGGMTSIG